MIRLLAAVRAWWARIVIADDPWDRSLDGLGSLPEDES